MKDDDNDDDDDVEVDGSDGRTEEENSSSSSEEESDRPEKLRPSDRKEAPSKTPAKSPTKTSIPKSKAEVRKVPAKPAAAAATRPQSVKEPAPSVKTLEQRLLQKVLLRLHFCSPSTI